MQKLFSVTLNDCNVDTFRSGGKGGQNQNKVESGVRITHLASGAIGEARDSRSQLQNKRAAMQRMADTKVFRLWCQRKAAYMLGQPYPEEIVDRQMQIEHITTEVKQDGRWVPVGNEIVAQWTES